MKGTDIFSTCFLLALFGLLSVGTDAQSVKVVFYHIRLEEWNEHGSTSVFQTILAAEANSFCQSQLSLCGINEWLPNSPFIPSDVGVVDGFPAQLKSDVVLYVNIQMNMTMNVTDSAQTHLSAGVVRDLIKNSRQALRVATGSWIVFIDREHSSPPPSKRANEVIIPIAFIVLLLLIVLAIGLHYWRKRKDAAERRMEKKLNKSYGKSRVSPNHAPSRDHPNKDTKASQLEMIYPPSRHHHHRSTDQNSSLHTATPSNISVTGDLTDGVKYQNEDEGRKRHKRRHRKKKHREGETTEEHRDGQSYTYQRFAQPDRLDYNGVGVTGSRVNTEVTEM